jgi:hypothetical protein
MYTLYTNGTIRTHLYVHYKRSLYAFTIVYVHFTDRKRQEKQAKEQTLQSEDSVARLVRLGNLFRYRYHIGG